MIRRIWFPIVLSAFILSACGSRQTPTPLPTVMLDDNASALTQETQGVSGSTGESLSAGAAASGVLVSDQHVDLAFQMSGNVKTVNTGIGQNARKGEVLAELDNSLLLLELEQANLALNELTSPMAVSSAQKAVADDQTALSQAKGTYYWWLSASSHQDLIDKAKADLVVAQDVLKKAQEDYDKLFADLYSDKDKAIAYQRLYEAQKKAREAKSQVDLYESADAYQLAIDKADAEVAQAKLDEDQTLLAALTGGELPENPTGSGYARLVQARINVQVAQARLAESQLIAPFNGTVAAVNTTAGDFAPAGQIQMIMVDPNHLHIETTDLSERDVSGIRVDQSVEVTVKPLNQTVSGKVSAIAPLAESLGGDVVYKVIIRLDELPQGALPGMSVNVNFLN